LHDDDDDISIPLLMFVLKLKPELDVDMEPLAVFDCLSFSGFELVCIMDLLVKLCSLINDEILLFPNKLGVELSLLLLFKLDWLCMFKELLLLLMLFD